MRSMIVNQPSLLDSMVSYGVTEKDSISPIFSHFARRTGQDRLTPRDEHMSLDRQTQPTRSIRPLLAPFVQKVDGAIHWINHYPVDNAIGFRTTYQLDSELFRCG